MSKVQLMGAGAIDPIAQSKRVFFRPVADTDVVKVGYAVCYNSDLAGDHKERGVGSDPPGDHLGGDGTDYAEGNQTYTGRMFIVEKPSDDNEEAFAGIVKCLGPKAGADGDMIEIWVPNGAMLPCHVEAVCVVRRTPLYVKSGSYSLQDDGAKIVGLAQESIDRTTAGICWVKVDRQLNLNAVSTVYLTALSGDARIKQLQVKSLSTVGTSIKAYNMYGSLEGAGTGGCNAGFLSVQVDLTATSCVSSVIAIKGEARVKGSVSSTAVLSANMNLIGVAAFAGCPYATYATMTGNVYALHCKVMVNTAVAGKVAQILFENTGGRPDYLFEATHLNAICGTYQLADTSTQTWGTDDIVIPILVSGTPYWIYASAAITAA